MPRGLAGMIRGPRTAAAIDLHLAARAGYHVNLDYPVAFVPSPEGTHRESATSWHTSWHTMMRASPVAVTGSAA